LRCPSRRVTGSRVIMVGIRKVEKGLRFARN
jgi:hypothetical protein